ncbi:MAG: hydroxymethylbilane synthase [Dehalococcoidia bacterium]|nr:hydroxymethylbilane synthase [Dehalococcoidia bacterium]
MRNSIVIGTRGSKLALVQAGMVIERLKQLAPGSEIRTEEITTHGDRNQQISLERLESTGVFVKDIEEALLSGRIDLAVHSLKDVPTEIPRGLKLAAVLERGDPRDVLVTRGPNLATLPAGARIGTSSLRRSIQLKGLRADVELCSIRGNVDTRLRKVDTGEYDGAILAAAGLVRLGCADRIVQYLPLETYLPAVGQAALVIETRADDMELLALLQRLNHLPTWQAVTAERFFLYELGGGCQAPIAALGTIQGDKLILEGMVASIRHNRLLRASETGSADKPERVGKRLAARLVRMGAVDFINEAKQNDG